MLQAVPLSYEPISPSSAFDFADAIVIFERTLVVELDFVYLEGTVLEASAETRAAIWAEIMDTGREIEGLPRRLQDSWDDGKRSREYLNSDNDEVTLNAQYYIHAYVH